MKQLSFLLCACALIVIIGTSGIKSVQYASTPPTGYTGATTTTCISCHSGNTLNAAGGSVSMAGLPAVATGYTFGQSYSFSITITHASANRKKWGFAIKAVDANGAAIGTFTTTNVNAQVVSSEIMHKNAPGSSSGASTFTYSNLTWKAPTKNTLANKNIRFFAVGNAADGTGNDNADFIYTTLLTVPIAVTAPTSVTSFLPTTASTGTTVVIKGVGFTGATAVSFGGTAAASYTISGDTAINAVVGSGTTGSVSVTSPSGTGTLAGFTFCTKVTPTINISTPFFSNCVGTPVTFTASISNGGGAPVYQWKKNNINVGTNSSTYTDNALNNQDSISCVLTSNATCVTSSTATSNTLKMTITYNFSGNLQHPTKGNVIPTVTTILTGPSANSVTNSGTYNFTCLSSGTIKLSKNNDKNKVNGVSSIDVILVQNHVLNKLMLNSPYKIIAADVNGDKKITNIDIIFMKRLILGTDTTFTGNRLWAFVDSAYTFPNPANPFPYKDSISFTGLSATKTNQTFIGVKLGDVDYNWNAATAKQTQANNTPIELYYEIESATNARITPVIRIPIRVKNFKALLGMQYTLNFDHDAYDYVGIENNLLKMDFNDKQATANNGHISFLWTDANSNYKTLEDGTVLFELILKSKSEIRNPKLEITSDITSIEAYDKDLSMHDIILSRVFANDQPLVKESWSVSPNPTTGKVNINIVSKVDKVIGFELSNADGEVLMQQNFETVSGNNTFTINLKQKKSLPAGIYFLKAAGIEGDKVKRIVIQ